MTALTVGTLASPVFFGVPGLAVRLLRTLFRRVDRAGIEPAIIVPVRRSSEPDGPDMQIGRSHQDATYTTSITTETKALSSQFALFAFVNSYASNLGSPNVSTTCSMWAIKDLPGLNHSRPRSR
jgi:hypothetical protein